MSSIKGKTIVFTGTLSLLKRAEAKKQAEDAGAKVAGAVSGNTDIVVTGPGTGSKLDDAKAKGTLIWTEQQFIDAVSGGNKPAAKKSKAKAAEESSDEEKPAPKKAKAKAKAKAAGKKAKDESDEEEEEEEEKPAPKKAKAKAKAKAAAKEEAEEEKPKSKKKAAAKSKKEEEYDDEKPAKKSKAAAAPAPTPAPAAAAPAAKPAAAGGAPRAPRTDRSVPNAAQYTVHEEYAVKLNQTNIGGNNNKFYFIQLLNKGGAFSLWTRWGRVGEEGQNMMQPAANAAAGISMFEKKFREKTANSWDARASFVKKEGKYQLVDTEETEGDGDGASVPLGKLSKPQIEKGQAVLQRIEEAINSGAKNTDALSSEFFSLIPTDFKRKRPEPIRTIPMLREKEELLKFYLRMGFEAMDEEPGLAPIHGVMELPLPATLKAAASNICGGYDISASDSKGEELAKKQAGKPVKHMAAHLYAALMLYTSNAIYAALNKVLRDENRAGVKKYFNYLRLFFEAFSHLPPQKRTLWRGISVDLYEQYKVGSTITWWGVSSCTSDESVARNFMRGCGGKCTLLTVDTKTACDISSITFYSNEKESLLAPGTQLKVKSSKVNGLVTEIHLEEVGRVVS